jgi:hypothetical protein
VYVPPPVPRCSGWASSSLISPSRISLPRNCSRVGLHIVLFGACSAFTRVAARTLAPSPICDALHRRLQPFRHLHDCSGCFRLERSPGGTCTHWKAPPFTAHARSGPCGRARRTGSNRPFAAVPSRSRKATVAPSADVRAESRIHGVILNFQRNPLAFAIPPPFPRLTQSTASLSFEKFPRGWSPPKPPD